MNLAICQSCHGKGFRKDGDGGQKVCEICEGDGCVDRRPELPHVPACEEYTEGKPAGCCIGSRPGCEKCARLAPDLVQAWADQCSRRDALVELQRLRDVEDKKTGGFNR